MDKEKFLKGVHEYLRLVHLYLNKKEDPEYEVTDGKLSFFTRLSKANSLSALLYQTLKNTKVKIDADKLNGLEVSYAANIKKGIGGTTRLILMIFLNPSSHRFWQAEILTALKTFTIRLRIMLQKKPHQKFLIFTRD